MEVQQEGSVFVLPCREWMSLHLDRPITYSYQSKRNAVRASRDPKRNLVTSLCYYGQCLYERVCCLETILLGIKSKTDLYDFDDAESVELNGGSAVRVDPGPSGVNSESSAGVAGAGAGDEGADSGAKTTDAGSSGTDERSS